MIPNNFQGIKKEEIIKDIHVLSNDTLRLVNQFNLEELY